MRGGEPSTGLTWRGHSLPVRAHRTLDELCPHLGDLGPDLRVAHRLPLGALNLRRALRILHKLMVLRRHLEHAPLAVAHREDTMERAANGAQLRVGLCEERALPRRLSTQPHAVRVALAASPGSTIGMHCCGSHSSCCGGGATISDATRRSE